MYVKVVRVLTEEEGVTHGRDTVLPKVCYLYECESVGFKKVCVKNEAEFDAYLEKWHEVLCEGSVPEKGSFEFLHVTLWRITGDAEGLEEHGKHLVILGEGRVFIMNDHGKTIDNLT